MSDEDLWKHFPEKDLEEWQIWNQVPDINELTAAELRELRRADYIAYFIDLVGPLDEWPNTISYLIKLRHLENQQRFKVIVFLLHNGISPNEVRYYLEECFEFDHAAWRQINWILRHWINMPWTAWNVAMRRSVGKDTYVPSRGW